MRSYFGDTTLAAGGALMRSRSLRRWPYYRKCTTCQLTAIVASRFELIHRYIPRNSATNICAVSRAGENRQSRPRRPAVFQLPELRDRWQRELRGTKRAVQTQSSRTMSHVGAHKPADQRKEREAYQEIALLSVAQKHMTAEVVSARARVYLSVRSSP